MSFSASVFPGTSKHVGLEWLLLVVATTSTVSLILHTILYINKKIFVLYTVSKDIRFTLHTDIIYTLHTILSLLFNTIYIDRAELLHYIAYVDN